MSTLIHDCEICRFRYSLQGHIQLDRKDPAPLLAVVFVTTTATREPLSPPLDRHQQNIRGRASDSMERLFVYGSLQPGGPNESVISKIGGEWTPATVRGRLVEGGWGASLGYPGLVIDEAGGEISGYVFTSSNLSTRWPELDAFEGEEYRRVLAPVKLAGGERSQAFVYVLRSGPESALKNELSS